MKLNDYAYLNWRFVQIIWVEKVGGGLKGHSVSNQLIWLEDDTHCPRDGWASLACVRHVSIFSLHLKHWESPHIFKLIINVYDKNLKFLGTFHNDHHKISYKHKLISLAYRAKVHALRITG